MAPPVKTKNPVRANGTLLVRVDDLPPTKVVEVETETHGVLAVGLSGDTPFAVSNLCRHQFAKLGQGCIDEQGLLVCPWHRSQYDVSTGEMVSGPKGRIFGFPPYSKTVKAVNNAAFRLDRHPVEIRDGAIHLVELEPLRTRLDEARAEPA